MPLHTGRIWKVTPTPICLCRLINASFWATNAGYIHALFHSQHIPGSAAAWRNMSHALGTSCRVFLVLSSVFLDPILSLPCSRWILHKVLLWCSWCISHPCSLHSNGSHKASFPTPSLKSRTKAETGGKSSSRTFFLAFESSAPKIGRGFSSKLLKSSIL